MGSSPMATDRVVVPRGEMESLVNSIKAEAIRVRSLIRLSFWKASRYSTLAKLSMSIITLFTRMLAILTEITKVSSWSEVAPEVPPTDKLLDMVVEEALEATTRVSRVSSLVAPRVAFEIAPSRASCGLRAFPPLVPQ
ncbi:hypothetical protein BHM03_00013066 [Ensete ventricosum]|nr:hypothetical protein BHM03_00013066 [Ensete ventricosum]